MEQSNLVVIGLLSSVGYFILFYAVILLFVSIWHVFKKARKPGWASVVPIYNIIIWLDIAEKPRIWLLLFFIPVINIIPAILVNISIAEKFGKSPAFGGVGLTFLSFIFYPLLASPKSKYLGSDESEVGTSKINILGLLLATFVIFVFVSYPIQIVMGLISHFTMPESAKPVFDIPSWSIWVTIAGSVLFFAAAFLIWDLKKLGIFGFIGLSVVLFLVNISIGHPIVLALIIFVEPLFLLLLARSKWEVFE